MDANKLDKLRSIGYKVCKTCEFCRHSVFPNNEWGTCYIHGYVHLKHGNYRDLSIHKAGSCESFDLEESKVAYLDKFKEFIDS